MLSPLLGSIKGRLESKPTNQLSSEEKQLLEELRFLDRRPEMPRIIQEGERDRVLKIVSGPGGPCPCCGR